MNCRGLGTSLPNVTALSDNVSHDVFFVLQETPFNDAMNLSMKQCAVVDAALDKIKVFYQGSFFRKQLP